MSHDIPPTPPSNEDDLPADELPPNMDDESIEEDDYSEKLHQVSRSTVFKLGRLGVPAAVLADAKSRADSIEAVATILQISIDPEDRDGYEVPSVEHRRDMLAIKSRNPSLKLSRHPEFSDKMTSPPIDKNKPSASAVNFWTAVRTFAPYEHSAVRKLQLAIEVEPYTGASSATAIFSFRPSTFSSAVGLSRLATIKQAIERLNPLGDNENPEKVYALDGRVKGMGVLWNDNQSDGIVTVEIRELDIIIRQSFERGEIERDEGDNLTQSTLRQVQLEDQLERHEHLMTGRMPLYTEFLLQLWPDEALPEVVFELEANKHKGEGDLRELEDLNEELDLKEVPSEVVDRRQREIYKSAIQPKPEVTFDMIGGLTDEKRTVQRLVNRAMHPERYSESGVSPKATGLLVGPPGCGKTMLAEAAAHKMDGTYLSVKVSDIESMWAGEAEKNIDALFGLISVLAPNRPLVVLIDELEGIASSRTSGGMMNWERKITTQLLGALNKNYSHCLILAATNDGGHVDPAITRTGRFSEIITVMPPDREARHSIFTKWINHFTNAASIKVFKNLDIDAFVTASEGLTGSDIATILENVLANAVEDGIDNSRQTKPIGTKKILRAIEHVLNANILRKQSYL